MTDRDALVALNAVEGIGPATIRKLKQDSGSYAGVFAMTVRQLQCFSYLSKEMVRAIRDFPVDVFLKQEYQLAETLGARFITMEDKAYPRLLSETVGAPVVLSVLGELLPAEQLTVALVGSRRASIYGSQTAEQFASQLAERGCAVISGLARGIDSAAHRGCLRAGGRTVAVLGSGLNNLYPRENKELAVHIAQQGAVISEFALNTPPVAGNFPRRNRVISGLSMGVVVVEAAAKSGALITARFALEQGREVFAVPGKVNTPTAKGNHRLIQQGAKLVTSVDDILEEFAPVAVPGIKTVTDNIPETGPGAASLSPEEDRLFNLVGQAPKDLEVLALNLSWSIEKIMNIVLQLELKQFIKHLPGRQVVRV